MDFSALQEITNPLLRSMVGGMAVGSILTVGSVGAITLGNLRGESNYRNFVYIISGGTGLGLVGGLILGKGRGMNSEPSPSSTAVAQGVWQD